MGRPKKEVKENGTPEGYVSKANFMRTRDSIVTGLTELENLVTNLRSAFVQHTSEVLSGQSAGPDTLAISNPLGNAGRGITPAPAEADVKQKKKKVKKEKDPNAPKRPLTAYLLYAQSARSTIKDELGEGIKPGEVAEEITKRWHEMPDGEKSMWKEAYQTNREKHLEELAEYLAKTGKVAPIEASPHDDEIPDADATAAALADDTEESSQDEDEEEEEEEEEEEVAKSPTPAPKLPTPPISQPIKTTKGRKAKAGKENGVTAELPSSAPQASQASQASTKKNTRIPVPAASPEPAVSVKAKSLEKRKKEAKESSPEEPKKKKKSRKSKGGEESQSTQEAEPAPPPTSEKKSRKKRKSDAA